MFYSDFTISFIKNNRTVGLLFSRAYFCPKNRKTGQTG
ncbi:hypothetical protein DHBDCA_p1010 [Dehalobacter sp. DCA]|nr:hypothetical protein DHBDCA_p1010 [Dehalobacter sp. DCA]